MEPSKQIQRCSKQLLFSGPNNLPPKSPDLESRRMNSFKDLQLSEHEARKQKYKEMLHKPKQL